MKIAKPVINYDSETKKDNDLPLFLNQPEPRDLAVCQGCKYHTPLTCSQTCVNAPRALSIEPDRYPVESNVVGMVYELMATRLIQTCWSCEGHMDENNKLWKIPQVCFYSAAPIYVKLLQMHLGRLQQKRKLKYEWHIVLTDFSQTEELTYSIQPNLNQITNVSLGALQADLRTLSVDLHTKLKDYAVKLLSK